MNYSDLQAVAKRVVWFKTPEETLRDVKLFLAYVMTYGTLSDISTTLQHFSENDFEAVLNDPPAGVFDRPFLELLEFAISSRTGAGLTQAKNPCLT